MKIQMRKLLRQQFRKKDQDNGRYNRAGHVSEAAQNDVDEDQNRCIEIKFSSFFCHSLKVYTLLVGFFGLVTFSPLATSCLATALPPSELKVTI